MARATAMRCEIESFDLPRNPASRIVRLRDEAAGLEATVVPAMGGEIGSLRRRVAGQWRELLHRAMAYDAPPPDGWAGRAPLLWPIAGRVFTPEQLAEWRRTGERPRGCRYHLGGRTYEMPMHGFARLVPWKLDDCTAERDAAWARCSLTDTAESRKLYPFAFELSVTHRIERGCLTSRYELTAGKNRRPMPFTIGNHIGVRLPFLGKGRYGDCAIRTPASRFHLLSPVGQFTGKQSLARLSRPVPLASGQLTDNVLGGYRRGQTWVEVSDPASFTLRVGQRELPVSGRTHARQQDVFFVFYGKRKFKYFCPEPWVGRINSLNTGKGAVTLRDGEKFVWEMSVEIRRRAQ